MSEAALWQAGGQPLGFDVSSKIERNSLLMTAPDIHYYVTLEKSLILVRINELISGEVL